MTNLEKLQSFFAAENARDWEAYATFLSDDIFWELHGQTTEVIRGKENYLTKIKAAYAGNGSQFTCSSYQCNQEQSCIVTLLENDLGATSCDIFKFDNGLIVSEYEFLL